MWYICFVQICFCFPENLHKLYGMPTATKWWSADYQHKNFAPEKCKSKFAFLLHVFVYLCGRYWQIILAKDQDFSSKFEFTARV